MPIVQAGGFVEIWIPYRNDMFENSFRFYHINVFWIERCIIIYVSSIAYHYAVYTTHSKILITITNEIIPEIHLRHKHNILYMYTPIYLDNEGWSISDWLILLKMKCLMTHNDHAQEKKKSILVMVDEPILL